MKKSERGFTLAFVKVKLAKANKRMTNNDTFKWTPR